MAWHLLGHPELLESLTRGISARTLSHAYLLVGPPDVGKRSLAVELAAALNCQSEEKPCGTCTSCRRILQGKHPDIHIVEPRREATGAEERVSREIVIDQIRELQRLAALQPFEGYCRAFIIDGADRMRVEAANCLLKTLEEPAESVVLLLLAAREDLVLPTVKSRCQRIELKPLPTSLIASALRDSTALTEDEVDLLSRLANGRLGWAMRAAKDTSVLADRAELLQQLEELLASGIPERLSFAASMEKRFSKNRQGAIDLLDHWAGWWRDLLLTRAGCSDLVANVDRAANLAELAAKVDLGQVHGFLKRLELTTTQIEHNVNLRLALETLLIEMPSTGTGARSAVVAKGES